VIKIAITVETFDALASTLPLGSVASPRVTPGTMRFSQTRQGAFLQTPSRRPAERHNGRGPPTPPVASTFGQHTYRTGYYRSIRGIFLKEGFQATIWLQKAPPRGALPPEALSIPPTPIEGNL
jgi:hypothetical protein